MESILSDYHVKNQDINKNNHKHYQNASNEDSVDSYCMSNINESS